MSSEIIPAPDPAAALAAEKERAEILSASTLVPEQYRNRPANTFLAVGYGQALGLNPAESLLRIHVIEGKPSLAAEFINARVREAGHKLRISGDETSATCTIIRRDDPDHEFTVTRDVEWAKTMGLTDGKRGINYRRQPGTMLANRAITACARLACPEAFFGAAYTPDELGDEPSPARPEQSTAPAVDWRAVAEQTRRQTHIEPPAQAQRVVADTEVPAVIPGQDALDLDDAEKVAPDDSRAAPAEPEPVVVDLPDPATKQQLATLRAQYRAVQISEREDQLRWAREHVGRDIGSHHELTHAEADALLVELRAMVEARQIDEELDSGESSES